MRKEIASVMWANRAHTGENKMLMCWMAGSCTVAAACNCIQIRCVRTRVGFCICSSIIFILMRSHCLQIDNARTLVRSFSLFLSLGLAISFQYNLILWSSQIVSIVSNFLLKKKELCGQGEQTRAGDACTHTQHSWVREWALLCVAKNSRKLERIGAHRTSDKFIKCYKSKLSAAFMWTHEHNTIGGSKQYILIESHGIYSCVPATIKSKFCSLSL